MPLIRSPRLGIALFVSIGVGAALVHAAGALPTDPSARELHSDIAALESRLDQLQAELEKERQRNESIEAESRRLHEEVLAAMLAETTERIVRDADAKTDRERVIAIASWVASNISNRGQFHGGPLTTFSHRAGLCGERAELAVEMLEVLHIPAKVFNIYNFGRPGGGHSVIQAHIDGDWAYFDVMYAGYFERDSEILSWAEITADPQAALESMVVFPETIDRWGGFATPTEDRLAIENPRRMGSVYTLESISDAAQSAGFARSPDVKTLTARVSLDEGAVVLGQVDGSAGDVQREALVGGISEQIGASTNRYFDSFQVRWELRGLQPGVEHELEYTFYRWSEPGLALSVSGENAEFRSAENFVTTKQLSHREGYPWTIRFTPTTETASILVAPQFGMDKGLFVDQIKIGIAEN